MCLHESIHNKQRKKIYCRWTYRPKADASEGPFVQIVKPIVRNENQLKRILYAILCSKNENTQLLARLFETVTVTKCSFRVRNVTSNGSQPNALYNLKFRHKNTPSSRPFPAKPIWKPNPINKKRSTSSIDYELKTVWLKLINNTEKISSDGFER